MQVFAKKSKKNVVFAKKNLAVPKTRLTFAASENSTELK